MTRFEAEISGALDEAVAKRTGNPNNHFWQKDAEKKVKECVAAADRYAEELGDKMICFGIPKDGEECVFFVGGRFVKRRWKFRNDVGLYIIVSGREHYEYCDVIEYKPVCYAPKI